ncbi:HIT family protein [Natrarchaeobius oligotrophus]|uniref:HIT domain-containing protein n=1 Tax=Natrarchaeobius chitinivorans TaxID=1679083 RepID=A0A3N6M560_NATCH|nr:HIT domain-containing protein [Natrarchaeobius chitinivorans]RQG98698.1 HIT domain-containing protein [Natrarchaeobius chitinivorans]
MHDDCPFCRIVAGDESAAVLYEDDRTIAFLDQQPAATGHALVVPRTHAEEIFTEDSATTDAVFDAVRTVAGALEDALEPDGFSVFHTSGPLVGTVDHAHVHVVPRTADDDVSLALSRRGFDPDEADRLASRVRNALET